jgi:hypothetical protein
MIHRAKSKLLLAVCALALVCAARQETDAGPRIPARTPVLEAIRRFDPTRQRISPSLVRVALSYEFVHRVVGTDKEIITPTPLGTFLGLVIDPLPIIAIPTASASPPNPAVRDRSPVPMDDGKAAAALRGPYFDALLPSRAPLRLVVREVSRPLGWTFLVLDDGADPPAELRQAIVAPAKPRSIAAHEEFAIPFFRDSSRSNVVASIPGRLPAGSESFLRPALVSVPIGVIGSPLFTLDGEWLGVVNTTAPGEEFQTARRAQPEVAEVSPQRDPAETSSGQRWPLLYSVVEVVPEIERVRRAICVERDLEALALRLVDRGGKIEIVATGDPLTAALEFHPELVAGDRITAVAAERVTTVLGFERALERAFASDPTELALAIERGDEELLVSLRFKE